MTKRISALRMLEWCLRIAGVLLLGFYALAILHRTASSRLALQEFDKAQANAPTAGLQSAELKADEEADFTLWSKDRIQAYQKSLRIQKGAPLATLRIARLGIRVPVFEGTDELVLNRGVGWIAGTARPGEAGNVGIAGHRDGFFRVLKDTSLGDTIELSTRGRIAVYTVDQVEIVERDNISVLRPRPVRSLTLVTCYPFYFIGNAPQRFILHATLQEPGANMNLKPGSPPSEPDKPRIKGK